MKHRELERLVLKSREDALTEVLDMMEDLMSWYDMWHMIQSMKQEAEHDRLILDGYP